MVDSNDRAGVLDDIRTPLSRRSILLNPVVAEVAARLGVRLLARPLRIGRTAIAARYGHVREILSRDLDFRIAPVNEERINAVNDPFVLGMDRSERLSLERYLLYKALAAVDFLALLAEAERDAQARLDAAEDRIDAIEEYARAVAGNTARRLFGVAGPDAQMLVEVVRAIFAHTFLNLNNDRAVEARALKAAPLMRSWLETEIRRRRAAQETGPDFMGALMRAADSDGRLDDDGVRRILGGMLVGSIDTTATTVANILTTFGRDPALAASARKDAGRSDALMGWCREALRRTPHNPVLVRETVAQVDLDGVALPAGTRVFAWTQAAMQDAAGFPEPRLMRPDREPRTYLHFGGALHACAGRKLNDLQIPMLISLLLRRGIEETGRVQWAGPFPAHLPLRLRRTP